MKTDAKTMAEVLRKVANNIENGIQLDDEIQMEMNNCPNNWVDRVVGNIHFPDHVKYRIKPKNIIVNGVEIPKPLDACDIKIKDDNIFYMPSCLDRGWESFSFGYYNNYRPRIVYSSKEEAIEASKKLFGIE